MKTLGRLTLLMFSFLLIACQDQAPKADFYFLDGKPGRYSELEGQWLFINYWAEWCKPCISEIPELNAFDSDNDHVKVIGIHYDAPAAEKQQQLVEELSITFTVIIAEPHQHYGFELPRVLPTTAVINPQGKLVTLLRGPQDEHSLAAALAPFQQ